jgi:hypothetical protein
MYNAGWHEATTSMFPDDAKKAERKLDLGRFTAAKDAANNLRIWELAFGFAKSGFDFAKSGGDYRKLCRLCLSLLDRMDVKRSAFGEADSRLSGW